MQLFHWKRLALSWIRQLLVNCNHRRTEIFSIYWNKMILSNYILLLALKSFHIKQIMRERFHDLIFYLHHIKLSRLFIVWFTEIFSHKEHKDSQLFTNQKIKKSKFDIRLNFIALNVLVIIWKITRHATNKRNT